MGDPLPWTVLASLHPQGSGSSVPLCWFDPAGTDCSGSEDPAAQSRGWQWLLTTTAVIASVAKLKPIQLLPVWTVCFCFVLGWTSYWLWRGFVAVPVWRGLWGPFAEPGVPPGLQWGLSPWGDGEGLQETAPGLTQPQPCWALGLPHFALICSQAMKCHMSEIPFFFFIIMIRFITCFW